MADWLLSAISRDDRNAKIAQALLGRDPSESRQRERRGTVLPKSRPEKIDHLSRNIRVQRANISGLVETSRVVMFADGT